MSQLRKLLTIALAVTLLSVGLGITPADAGTAGTFISKINSERAARGLNKLQVYWDLTDDAKAHSKRMMNKDKLYHNPNLAHVTSGWQALAENVGVGHSVDSLHKAFMKSSGHRKNILGNYNYIGVGVAKEAGGKMWVTVVFMRGPKNLLDPPDDPPKPQPPTTQPPTTQPPTTQPPTTQPPTTQPPKPISPTSRPPASSAGADGSGVGSEAVGSVLQYAPLPHQPRVV